MTVDEMLKLKENGLSVEEIAQLAPHIQTPVEVAKQPTGNEAILGQLAAGLTAMQEQLKQMHQESGQHIAQALADIQQKMQYGNVNRPTGAEAAQPSDNEAAAAAYIANIINPTTNEPIKEVKNA